MRRPTLLSHWDGLFSALGFSRRKGRKGIKPQRRRTFAIEPLEERQLLSVTCHWSGASSIDANWSTADNWWVGNAQNHQAPVAGDTLCFDGTAQTTTNNDFTAGTPFHSIEFAAGGFTLAGNPVALTDSITVDTGVSGSAISLNAAVSGSITANVASSETLAVSGILSGAGSLTKTGGGTLSLSGDDLLSGVTISAGTLKIRGENVSAVNYGDIDDEGSLVFDSQSDLSIGGAISGDGSVTQRGSGALYLTGTNTYSGGTTIDAGTLLVGADGAAGKSVTLTAQLSAALAGQTVTFEDYTTTPATVIGAAVTDAEGVASINYVLSGDALSEARDVRAVCGSETQTATLNVASPVAGWLYRKAITIDHTDVGDQDLTDFPLYVKMDGDTDLAAALSDGCDVRFTAADGTTLLDYERESWSESTSGGVTSVTATFWVKVPTISHTDDTTIYCYYGNADAPDGQNAAAVWTNGYGGVWHLQESGTGTAGDYQDSTAYGDDSTDTADQPTRVAGLFGYAQEFDGDQHIAIARSSSLEPQSLTMSAWVSIADNGGMVFQKPYTSWANPYFSYAMAVASTYVLGRVVPGDIDDSNMAQSFVPVTPNTWYFVSATFDGTNLTTYLNGVNVGSNALPVTIVYWDTDLWFGHYANFTFGYAGMMEEARLSDVARSPAWIKFEYDNIAQSGNELGWSAAEPLLMAGPTPDSGTIGAGGVTIAAGAALVFNRSNDIAVPNTISGDGSLAQEGDGTLTLTATNDYTGGTTIDSGAIQLGDGTTDGSLLGDVLENAWLVFANESALAFGGDISGDGSLYKTGDGTLTLTGANTYTGGTTIDAGTLQLGDGTTDGSLTGDITDNAALVFANAADMTFDGAIDGTGSLAKTGAGLLTLSGTDSHTGSTTAGGGGLLYILAAGSENVLEGTQLSFSLNMDDFSLVPATMTFSLETTAPTPPTGLSFDSTTQYVTWTPGTNWGGHSATIKVTAANSTAHISATQVISIDVYDKDRPPTISSPSGNLQATENTPFTFNFYDPLNPLASDPDAADVALSPPGAPCTLTFSIESVDQGMYTGTTAPSIDPATGVFSWTPSEANGGATYHFSVRVTDEAGLSAVAQATTDVTAVDGASTIVGPSSITVTDRTASRVRFSIDDPDMASGVFGLSGNYPSQASITGGGVFCWDPSLTTATGTYQFTVNLHDYYNPSTVYATKVVSLTVGAENGHTPLVGTTQYWTETFYDNYNPPDVETLTLYFGAYNPEGNPAETTTYWLTDYPTLSTSPHIDANGTLTWVIAKTDPAGEYSFTVHACDNGDPQYASQITACGQIIHVPNNNVAAQVANDDFPKVGAEVQTAFIIDWNNYGNGLPDANGDGLPDSTVATPHGTAAFSYNSGHLYCTYTPNQGFHGVDNINYKYPSHTDGGTLWLESNQATIHVAVDPLTVRLDVAGEWGTDGNTQTIIPVNTGWDEQGIKGVTRLPDNQHDGIVADDPQLRIATLTVTNNFPCAVTGQWSLLLRSVVPGFTINDYGSFARVYQQAGGVWQEIFNGQQFHVTIGAGQTLTVSLLLEGISSTDADPSHRYDVTATFHIENIADGILQGGLRSVPDVTDSLSRLTIAAVDLAVGPTEHPMPDVYKGDLPSVIPMNRDYDDGYADSNQNPLPDNTDPLPTGATPPPACAGEDDLVSGTLTLPYAFHGTWTLTIPTGLRVWVYDSPDWHQLETGVSYGAASGESMALRVEGLTASSAAAYLTVSAQYTDVEDVDIGDPLTDRVKVEVISVDLQIQNISEHDETTKPAFVPVNDDYDEGNTIAGQPVTDNNRLHGQLVSLPPPHIVPNDGDLVHGTLAIAGPSGQSGKWWIEVTGEPATVNGAGTGPGEYPGYQQYIRVWLPNGTPVPRDKANALPVTLNAAAVDLLIEGLSLAPSALGLVAHFEPDGDYAKAGVTANVKDSVMAKLIEVNLDTDSNNNGVINHDTDDPIESQLPGKVVAVHKSGVSDLVPVVISPVGATPAQPGQLTGVLAALGHITVWADAAGTQPIIAQPGGYQRWDLYNQTVPTTVYVKGESTGVTGLTWTVFAGSALLKTDDVTFTVAQLGNLTVTDHWTSTNSVAATDTTAKDIYVWQTHSDDAVDLTALFAPLSFGATGVGQFVHVTFKRDDGLLTVLDTTCLNQNTWNDRYLQVTDTARNFTVTDWLDLNNNGVLDSGEDYRTIYVHVVKATLHTVSFDKTIPLGFTSKFHAITPDPIPSSPSSYAAPQWLDYNDNGNVTDANDHDYPVCYTRSGTVAGTAGDVKMTTDVEIKVWGNPGTNIKVRVSGGIGGQTLYNPNTTWSATFSGDLITATGLVSDGALPNTVKDTTVSLEWDVSLDGGRTWYHAGWSQNHLYLTWNDPIVSSPYETCVYIGCHAANGLGEVVTATADQFVLSAIWGYGFTGCSVHRVDGTPLHYYSPWNTDVTSTADLLTNGNGQCGSWAHLFIDVLKAQGIYTDYSTPSAPSYYHDFVFVTPASGYADGFIVKDWTFTTGAGISGLTDFPYLDIPASPFMANDSYNGLYAQVTDNNGIAGQNSPNPASLFNNHQIVRVITKDSSGNNVETFYDPSYGVTYSSLNDMEQKAMAGYWRQGLLGVNETTVGLDLDHDGHIDDKVVNVIVYVFCKNDLGGHLIANTSVPELWRTY